MATKHVTVAKSVCSSAGMKNPQPVRNVNDNIEAGLYPPTTPFRSSVLPSFEKAAGF